MVTASIAVNLVKKGCMKRNNRRPFTRLTFLPRRLKAILLCLVATANSFVCLSAFDIAYRSPQHDRTETTMCVSVGKNKIDDKSLKSRPLRNARAGAYA
jgi:hypothetical protein